MAPFWHRWSYFSIINLSVFHLADKCFTITNLINLRIILFLEYRKTPETLRFRGILRLDTMLSYDNKSIFRLYYSMIVATRPDPTVRPPSRYQTGVLRCANGDFSCDLWRKIWIFPLCPYGFWRFCYHGVIIFPYTALNNFFILYT